MTTGLFCTIFHVIQLCFGNKLKLMALFANNLQPIANREKQIALNDSDPELDLEIPLKHPTNVNLFANPTLLLLS